MKEQIEKRLAELEQVEKQMLANLHATQGAILELKKLLETKKDGK